MAINDQVGSHSRRELTDGVSESVVPAATEAPDVVRIRRCLQVLGIHELQLHAFEQLPSTNVWLREQVLSALQAPPFDSEDQAASVESTGAEPVELGEHLCITDWQSAGAGRRGQPWQSRPGNLMFSILDHSMKTSRELMGLSLVTGIALAECLIQSAGVPVRLKWPNDLMLEDAKLGGLTTELFAVPSTSGEYGGTRILTGIGINLLDDSSVSLSDYAATSLQASGVSALRRDRDELAARLVARVLTAHRQFDEEGWSAFSGRWAALDWLRGRDVWVLNGGSRDPAVAQGVNEDGALLVDRKGEVVPVYSGDVSVRVRM